MKFAFYTDSRSFRFLNIDDSILEEFKEKYANRLWRFIDITDAKNKTEAINIAKREIRNRIIRINFTKPKKYYSIAKPRQDKGGAYRATGSLKTYFRAKRANRNIIGTQIF